MLINAKFIGENGSLGYIHGKVYNLAIDKNTIYLNGKNNNHECPYQTIESFLKNWDVINQCKL